MIMQSSIRSTLFVLLFSALIISSHAELPHHIATSDVPGELWILRTLPATTPYELPDWGLYHSTDYGQTFELVREGEVESLKYLDYHRLQQCVTFTSSNGAVMNISRDGGATIDEVWDWVYPYASKYKWVPDTTAWIMINETADYSFDSLRTLNTDVYDSLAHQIGGGATFALGWSANELLAKAIPGPEYDLVFALSQDYGMHWVKRSELPYGHNVTNVGKFFTGPSPGEAYIVHGAYKFFYASRDTLRTWVLDECTLLPWGELFTNVFWEFERGWEPGELYWYCYQDWPSSEPLAVLYRSTDFCRTWQEVFKTRDYYIDSVDESPATLPASPHLTVWPNPTNASAQFRWDATGPAQFSLYDLTGRLIYSGELAGSSIRALELGGLASGTYLLRVTPLLNSTVNAVQTRRIVLVK